MDDQGFAAERDALRLEYQGKMARHYGVSFEAWLAHELTESRKLRSQETARFLGVMMDARQVLRDWAQRPLPDMKPTEVAHGLRGHTCSVCMGVIPHGEVAAFADGGRGPARHLGCAPSALPGEGGTTEGQANG